MPRSEDGAVEAVAANPECAGALSGAFFIFFTTLDTGPSRPLSLEVPTSILEGAVICRAARMVPSRLSPGTPSALGRCQVPERAMVCVCERERERDEAARTAASRPSPTTPSAPGRFQVPSSSLALQVPEGPGALRCVATSVTVSGNSIDHFDL